VSASRSSRRSARLAVSALFAGFAALTAVSACSAGQIAQTSNEIGAVPGANVNVGPSGTISLRDMVVVYNGPQGYPQGASAPLVVRIFNNGLTKLTLVKVSAGNAAASVVLVGGSLASPSTPPTPTATPSTTPSVTPSVTGKPSGSASATTRSSATPTATPSATATKPPGEANFTIDIAPASFALLVPGQGAYLQLTGLTSALIPGQSVPLTFTFADGTTGQALVPVGVPQAPQPRETLDHVDVNEVPAQQN
jgi:hypothetical protein